MQIVLLFIELLHYLHSVPDVESTGGSNEFYDKFSIRYHISVILTCLWSDIKLQEAFFGQKT